MQKAKLNISKTKKGGYAVSLTFEDNKTLPLSDHKLTDDKLNGKEVEVTREGGQVKQIICEGQVIYDKTSQGGSMLPKNQSKDFANQPKQKNTQSSNSSDIQTATAPYNFVPLNHIVVPAEEILDFDIYHSDRHTGYIDLEIETKTPLYIRDILNEDEIKERDSIEDARKQNKSIPPYCNPDFFSPGNVLRIPGSSLRGMTRTMVEIVSFGKFGFFDDRRLYFRGLADLSGLRKEYQRLMSSYDKNNKKSTYKMSAGYIYKEGLKYYIQPAKVFKQIKKDEAKQLIRDTNQQYKTFMHYKLDNGYIVVSGDMQNKKRDWFVDLPDTSKPPIQISSADIQDYKNDTGRHKDVPNLLALAAKGKVPCFYTRYKDFAGKDRISFGHSAMFRLAYTKTIGDHIPNTLKDSNTTDIPEAIFGNEKTFAGRVFFEDAFCLSPREEALMGKSVPKILSGPKPTTFQHYLEQLPENLHDHPRNLAHYNSNTNIRGYKLYWHKDGTDWQQTNQTEINEHKSQYTKINPVKAGIKFKGRIRFENLSKVELGALLFAIDLPKECLHKLGMGKPLGLGSIKIKPELHISDRHKRYKSLTAEWGEIPIYPNLDNFKKAFEDYVIEKIAFDGTSLWATDRLKELKTMLDFVNKPSNEQTRYMEIEKRINGQKVNEFKNRPVLPLPTKVKNKLTF